MQYKDETGKRLYGFSQENLERTNKEIKKTNRLLQVLITFFGIFLVIFIALMVWLEVNDVITRMISG